LAVVNRQFPQLSARTVIVGVNAIFHQLLNRRVVFFCFTCLIASRFKSGVPTVTVEQSLGREDGQLRGLGNVGTDGTFLSSFIHFVENWGTSRLSPRVLRSGQFGLLGKEGVRDDKSYDYKHRSCNHSHVRDTDGPSTCNCEGNRGQEPDHYAKASQHSGDRKLWMNVHQAKSNCLRSPRPRPHCLFPHDTCREQNCYWSGAEPPHL
jgi:hypothetical protein